MERSCAVAQGREIDTNIKNHAKFCIIRYMGTTAHATRAYTQHAKRIVQQCRCLVVLVVEVQVRSVVRTITIKHRYHDVEPHAPR
jgi:hypothetical protein